MIDNDLTKVLDLYLDHDIHPGSFYWHLISACRMAHPNMRPHIGSHADFIIRRLIEKGLIANDLHNLG